MDNILEEWRPVAGWEGLYEVSNCGRVRSLDRTMKNKWGTRTPIKGRIMKTDTVGSGYKRVTLQDSQRVRLFVHRLVAFAFPEICGEYFEGAQINHKDENPENNAAWNLEWCTVKYNCNYGGHMKRIGEKMINRSDLSKPIIQLTKSGDFVKKWNSIKEAERSGIASKQNIMRVLKKKHGSMFAAGYKWVYETEYA